MKVLIGCMIELGGCRGSSSSGCAGRLRRSRRQSAMSNVLGVEMRQGASPTATGAGVVPARSWAAPTHSGLQGLAQLRPPQQSACEAVYGRRRQRHHDGRLDLVAVCSSGQSASSLLTPVISATCAGRINLLVTHVSHQFSRPCSRIIEAVLSMFRINFCACPIWASRAGDDLGPTRTAMGMPAMSAWALARCRDRHRRSPGSVGGPAPTWGFVRWRQCRPPRLARSHCGHHRVPRRAIILNPRRGSASDARDICTVSGSVLKVGAFDGIETPSRPLVPPQHRAGVALPQMLHEGITPGQWPAGRPPRQGRFIFVVHHLNPASVLGGQYWPFADCASRSACTALHPRTVRNSPPAPSPRGGRDQAQ